MRIPTSEIITKKSKRQEVVNSCPKTKQANKAKIIQAKTKSSTQNNINMYKQNKSLHSKCIKHAEQQCFNDLHVINTKKPTVAMLWKIFGQVINPGKM